MDTKTMRGCTAVRSLNNNQSGSYLNPVLKEMKDEGKSGGGTEAEGVQEENKRVSKSSVGSNTRKGF